MANFAPADFGRAIGQGNRNALLQMQAHQTGSKIRQSNVMSTLSQRAAQTGEDLPSLLEQAGMPQQANELRMKTIERGIKGAQYISKRAPMVRDQATLERFADDMESLQLAQPGEVPREWTPETQQFLAKISGNAQSMVEQFGGYEDIPGLPGAKGQRSKKSGKWANIKTAKDLSSGGRGGLKASDENAIYRQSGALFGGDYDPVSGQFIGLAPEVTVNVQAIASRASELYSKGLTGTRAQAVSKAARELGVNILDLSKKPAKPDPATEKLLQQARSAIEKGASRQEVINVLQQQKVDPRLL